MSEWPSGLRRGCEREKRGQREGVMSSNPLGGIDKVGIYLQKIDFCVQKI